MQHNVSGDRMSDRFFDPHTGTNTAFLRPTRRVSTTLAMLAAVIVATSTPSARASIEQPLNPCTFVTNDDVLHLLGWTVDGRQRRPYDLHGATGAMCFLSSTQGQVIVIVPDPGTAYPGISPEGDQSSAGLVRHVREYNADVTLYNGTVYVVKHHRNVAIRVVPQDHMASYAEVEGFAKVISKHLH
jgi:hypothetical protein